MSRQVRIPKVTTIDFETHGIEGRPDYPPKPVGVSIKKWGKKPKYYAFDHVVPHHKPALAKAHRWNDSTREEAVAALNEAYANPDGVLFQNGKFDLDVAEVHLGLKPPPWYQAHETVFLLFLDDPNAKTVGLKSAAAKYLGMPPDEQDALADWLVANQPVEGIRITRATGKTAKYPFGRYIAHAPGDVVGPYANGDVVRTERLFEHLYPRIVEAGMLAAYDRERRMVPVLLRMERDGIRVDEDRLASDVATYSSVIDRLEAWVRKRVGVADLNIDAGADLVAALINAGLADPARMGVTKKTGRTKSDKDAIRAGVVDPQLSAVLNYLARCKTCVRTFMEPWLATAQKTGGLIFTNWNQVFGDRGGTRTGRFSSTPNFQNIPKEFEPIFASDETHLPKAQRAGLPKAPFALPPLPMCRGYIIPYEKGHVLVGRDFSQQEPRILAHFDGAELMESYQRNPWKDYHDDAKAELEARFGRTYQRKPVKNINLGIIYGQGAGSLAVKNGSTVDETKALIRAIRSIYPGLEDMEKEMKRRYRAGEPITTWGGRVYYGEPPIIFEGRVITFDYKMINTLVQGSAADATKEAMLSFATQIGYAEVAADWTARRVVDLATHYGWRMLLQVHDEIVLSVPAKHAEAAQEMLRASMEGLDFDVPMLSEGSCSSQDWARMVDRDKKGKVMKVAGLPRQERVELRVDA